VGLGDDTQPGDPMLSLLGVSGAQFERLAVGRVDGERVRVALLAGHHHGAGQVH